MLLTNPQGEPVEITGEARQVYDVTGAGDTVTAMLAIALPSGLSLEQGAHLANRATGIVVSRVGTSTVTLAELLHG